MCLFKWITGLVSLKPFGKERVNEPKKFLKSGEKYFYPTFSWFWAKLSQKKLFLIKSEISGLLVNTLTGNYEYSRSNRENLPLPIQIKLSKKPSIFSEIFFAISESTLNFQCSEKNMSLIGQVFLKFLTPEYVFI